jgi:hypothetical protein
VEGFHEQDLAEGHGAVYLPYALERKYPGAARDWSWQSMIYTHVVQQGGQGVPSPLDDLPCDASGIFVRSIQVANQRER